MERLAESPAAPRNDLHDAADPEAIQVRGARVHNLQNVDIDIPRDQLVVITGPSGSGKSSLAFDTLYAEGQRQYIETLTVYARQYLHRLQRPDVDMIEGLQPTISIDQRAGSQSPRSTVATVTEIYDYLRLLYARVGVAHCYKCGAAVRQLTAEQIQETLLQLPEGTKLMLLAPLVRGRKGAHQETIAEVRKAGLLRVRVDGEVYEVEQVPDLAPRKNHTIEAIVDRIVIRPGIEARLDESIQLALRNGDGVLIACVLNGAGSQNGKKARWQDTLYSVQYACPDCRIGFESLEPRSFSFNSPYGACPTCEGLGAREQFDPELVLPDWELSLAGGAIVPWRGGGATAERRLKKLLEKIPARWRPAWDQTLAEMPPAAQRVLLHGEPESGATGTRRKRERFVGVLNELAKQWATTTRASRREQLEAFRANVECLDCGGARIRAEARSVRIGPQAIHELTRLTVSEARVAVQSMEIPTSLRAVADPLLEEIDGRLHFLERVGVAYLNLDRAANSLSGGELQRVRLASGIGSGLVGVCYILDEPSIGLHPRDNQRLIDSLRDLQRQGNSVIVVEHDEAIMRASDHLIDLGPGAGRQGGQVMAAGAPHAVAESPTSLTGQYLGGVEAIPVPKKRRRVAKSRSLHLTGARMHNLRELDLRVPLGALVCVTGVSGSGKSSLIAQTLAPALSRRLGLTAPKPGPHAGLRGARQVRRMVEIDQSPIGRTPRSNPATYSGVFDEIRKVFAGTKVAKQQGYRAGRFSFNVKGGRCEACQGQGEQKIEMSFLPNLHVTCAECNGARFNSQTLEVRWRGKTIADILDMCVDEACQLFESFTAIHHVLRSLQDVGLGYVALGQPSTTLSGGEGQRVKLATELARGDGGGTLYVLDEPTTGLHLDDIRRLLQVLQRLVDLGNTVLVVEHQLDVIKSADWVIDLGPEGGAEGGAIVAEGRPEDIAQSEQSYTGSFLRPLLSDG